MTADASLPPLTPADRLRWAIESGLGGVIEDYHDAHVRGTPDKDCLLCRLEPRLEAP